MSFDETQLYIGTLKASDAERWLSLSQIDRRRHMYVIGQTGSGKSIRLTERDREILLALHRYRFMTTDHLMTLTGTTSRWGMNARLRLLYDHKYVDRPKAQYAIFAYADKRPLVYALGNTGAALLSTRYGLKMPAKVYWTEKNRRVREQHIQHTLGISDFMISVEVMCKESDHQEFIDPQAGPVTQTMKHVPLWLLQQAVFYDVFVSSQHEPHRRHTCKTRHNQSPPQRS